MTKEQAFAEILRMLDEAGGSILTTQVAEKVGQDALYYLKCMEGLGLVKRGHRKVNQGGAIRWRRATP